MATRRLTDRTLDLDTLEVLERVAETGSLSRAAEVLGITQQAVSARVRRAEAAVGAPLVRRSAVGSVLTESGRLLLGLAGPVLDASRRFEAGLGALQRPTGSLVVAASQTIAELMLPSWLIAFGQRTPAVQVRLVAGNSATVVDLVRSGTAHLGFTETPDGDPGLSSALVAEDELVVVVAPAHPWATAPRISAVDLAGTALLVREDGSGTRATVETWIRAAGLELVPPSAVLETTAIIRANARAGVAPAVMSTRTVEADLASGALVRVPLDGPPIVRPLRAVWTGRPSEDTSAFLDVALAPGRSPGGSR